MDAAFDVVQVSGIKDDVSRSLRSEAILHPDVRERDRPADARTEAETVDMGCEEVGEMSLAVLGLFERIDNWLGSTVAMESEELAIAYGDLTPFRLDDENAVRGMEQREVGFSITLTATAQRLPLDVVEHSPVVIESAQLRENASL